MKTIDLLPDWCTENREPTELELGLWRHELANKKTSMKGLREYLILRWFRVRFAVLMGVVRILGLSWMVPEDAE